MSYYKTADGNVPLPDDASPYHVTTLMIDAAMRDGTPRDLIGLVWDNGLTVALGETLDGELRAVVAQHGAPKYTLRFFTSAEMAQIPDDVLDTARRRAVALNLHSPTMTMQ